MKHIHSDYHVPLPSGRGSHSIDLNTRGRSLSDGTRTQSARSSEDRVPTFFGTQTWQQMELPSGVRDPLNIDELEREERLMPYTDMAVEIESGRVSQQQEAWGVKPERTSNASNYLSVAPGWSGSARGIDWAYMQDHNLRTGGLPSLDQVLTRRTRAPLALRDFAVHCSVRQPQARRWLEFYMAARTHEKMCLAYESDLRHAKARSQYASLDSHLLPEGSRIASMAKSPEQWEARVDAMESLTHASGFRRSRRQSSRMAVQIQTSAETIFLRYFRAALDPTLLEARGPRAKIGSLRRMLTQKGTAPDDPYHQGYVNQTLGSTASLAMSRDHLNTPITMPFVANHLYYHMPWPPEILTNIEQRLLHDGAALDPMLFSDALLYSYDVLDTYYFPIFVSDSVSRNTTRDHCILRVMLAFVLLWFAFALPLAMILLDSKRAKRVWCVVPMLLGWWNMAVGFGGCDLLLAAMRKYQSPAMKDNEEREGGWRRACFATRMSVDPTAARMVRARSIRWFIGAVVMTAMSTAILCAVPGTHIYAD
ncbi:Bud site selection protein, Revert to axial protein 1 [Coemansia spiralis]|uniref:Bud site selection protein, Revert to axial protein 1 n=2 Tax=Coemansia TaxID=4863 RepID=A0A9W8KY39_9FUNG|nr:hypothetical protein BX070DRAFT_252818 [Coemansia spiralis]KAJ1993919.1 Bud site selection protein, Revert to axial protein 1 [Coemansia umbellata]KAJ2622684.1 Bud site selection protein, Revert to axial protein 1 [Coemansia sp. RSA 1358]KAJ2679103.1 Bud site selection protein, Revert to axial protein 1 [Coemansia spiralis]